MPCIHDKHHYGDLAVCGSLRVETTGVEPALPSSIDLKGHIIGIMSIGKKKGIYALTWCFAIQPRFLRSSTATSLCFPVLRSSPVYR